MLKHLRNLSDESVVEQWAKNAYYQYFGGQWTMMFSGIVKEWKIMRRFLLLWKPGSRCKMLFTGEVLYL
jgi:hypothetical protein